MEGRHILGTSPVKFVRKSDKLLQILLACDYLDLHFNTVYVHFAGTTGSRLCRYDRHLPRKPCKIKNFHSKRQEPRGIALPVETDKSPKRLPVRPRSSTSTASSLTSNSSCTTATKPQEPGTSSQKTSYVQKSVPHKGHVHPLDNPAFRQIIEYLSPASFCPVAMLMDEMDLVPIAVHPPGSSPVPQDE